MSEWFKELVLKTSDSERDRGFESHLLRLYRNLYVLSTQDNTQSNESSAWRSTQEAEGAPLERE